jgi:hypothetical protein
MARIQKYVAAAALAAVLAGTPSPAHAVSPGKAARAAGAHVTAGHLSAGHPSAGHLTSAQRKAAPTPRIVRPGEHVVAAPGFELWLTTEGKHWVEPDNQDPQFRSVVDGNIDLSHPGVSIQASADGSGNYHLSGVYYGGRGTASYVEVETTLGTVRGKLIELPGRPGWGAWYAVTRTDGADPGQGPDFLRKVTVYDTRGRVYSELPLR